MTDRALAYISVLLAHVLLFKDIRELLVATGLVAEADEERLFADTLNDDPPAQALARRFRALGSVSDPLAAEFRDPELWVSLLALARSRGKLTRWQGIAAGIGTSRGPDWADLSAEEQRDVRGLARHLAYYHASWIRRGRAREEAINTALSGLAEIYVRHMGLPKHPHELPHAEESAFVGFCAAAFIGVVPVTRVALSRRWRRLKAIHRDGLPVTEPLRRRRRARLSARLRRE